MPSSTRARSPEVGRISGEVVRGASLGPARSEASFEKVTPSSGDASLARTGVRLRPLAVPEAPVRVGVVGHVASMVLAVPLGLATATMLLFARLEEE